MWLWRSAIFQQRTIRAPERWTAVEQFRSEPTSVYQPVLAPAEVASGEPAGPFVKATRFYVRLNNGTRAIDDERERDRYIAQRRGTTKVGRIRPLR